MYGLVEDVLFKFIMVGVSGFVSWLGYDFVGFNCCLLGMNCCYED